MGWMDSTTDFFGVKPIATLRVMASSGAINRSNDAIIEMTFGGFP
jgi:hypothetical protein